MSNVLNCGSCGGSNQLLERKTSMFCSFCGNAIKLENKEKDLASSSIKNKPEISPKKIKIIEKKVNGEFPVLYFQKKNSSKIRKDDGWDVYDGFTWTFVRDQTVIEEEVLDKGGELKLNDRGIKSLNEIIEWYTDNELKSVRILSLANNNIDDFDQLRVFENVEMVDLSGNEISKFPMPQKLKKCVQIDLSKNPLPSTANFQGWQLFSSDFGVVFENGILKGKKEKMKCMECGVEILNTTFDRYDGCCRKCYDTVSERQQKEAFKMAYNATNRKSNSGNCFIATATMGSYDHPFVMELRHFRDEWILTKKWGESFVDWYYHYGAIAAKYIEKSFVLKKLSYLLIVKPLVYLSRVLKK